MSITPLVFHNNFVYCLAVVIIVSLLIKRNLGRYLLAVVLTTAAGLFVTLSGMDYLTMPITVCLLTLIFSLGHKQHEICNIFSKSLTAVFLSWCFITPLSSVIMMVAPEWHNGPGCNIVSGMAIMIFSLMVRCLPSVSKRIQTINLNRYVITLELLVLTFFTLILPQYFPVFELESKRQVGLFTLAFFVLLAFVSFIIHRMQKANQQHRELKILLKHQEAMGHQVKRQYDTVITLKHYYSKLYEGMAPLIRSEDMNGLKKYFEKYIAIIHQENVEVSQLLSNIKNEIIRNLLDVMISMIESMKGITLELSVEGIIEITGKIEMDIFEIVSNLLDNAIRELEGQSSGLLRIALAGDENTVSIEIANTVSLPIDIEKLCDPKIDGDSLHGHGLIRIQDIVCQHPEIEHFTYIKMTHEEKEVLVQQIVVYH